MAKWEGIWSAAVFGAASLVVLANRLTESGADARSGRERSSGRRSQPEAEQPWIFDERQFSQPESPTTEVHNGAKITRFPTGHVPNGRVVDAA